MTTTRSAPLRAAANRAVLPAVLSALVVAHFFASPAAEPFKNNDETRHVMTGVFFRDALCDLPASAARPQQYATRYYAQYPALGLLVWPPFFHAVEGLAMAALGTSYFTARAVVTAFGVLALWYAYRLALRTHGRAVAGAAVAVLGFAPVVFDHERYVLLEVPCLALVLACVFHFERYLDELRPRDGVLACLLAALAALTRYDGIVILPYVAVRLAAVRRPGLLLRTPVLVGVAAALLLTVPYYLFAWRVYGAGIGTAAVSGTNPEATGFLDARNFWLYPSYVPEQVGWAAAAAAGLGLAAAALHCASRLTTGAGPYLALIAATYLTCVPFAEPAARHAIYWVPALAVFAAVAVAEVAARLGRAAGLAAGAGLIAATVSAATGAGFSLRGYEEAGRYVVENNPGGRPVLMDGVLTGGFIYQVRRADPGRRVWVLRGDKLLYAVHSDPHGGYREFAATEADVLAVLHRYDPEFVVVEQPQLMFDLPAAAALRAALAAHPDRFRLEHVVPLATNHHEFRRGRLEIYRNLDRNPDAEAVVEVPVLGLGRSVRSGERHP